MSLYAKYGKSALDFVGGCAVAPFALAASAILGAAIKLGDGGPALHKSPRLGQDGEPFVMYKLRTMSPDSPDLRNADGSTLSTADDPRVTPIGRLLRRTSLDELPQVLNVLRGQMSFVGPRPDLVEQRAYYGDDQLIKLAVRPGITGLSQAYYRNSIPWGERLAIDAYYAENVSFILDTKILVKTVGSILTPKGQALVHQPSAGPTG